MKWCAAFSCGVVASLVGLGSALAVETQGGSSLQAGGLRPPEAVASDAGSTPSAQTEARLDRAEQEDSGRGLEFVWLNAELGPEYLGLRTLRDKHLLDSSSIDTKGAGMSYGAGVGVRFLVFTFGARFRLANFSDYQLWTLNAEAGMHFPLGRVEPYLTLGGGYASLGDFDSSKLGFRPNNAHGFDARAGFGVDVYLSNAFSVGGNLTGDVLFLSRSARAAPPAAGAPLDPSVAVYSQDGSGIGLGGTLTAVLGLHF